MGNQMVLGETRVKLVLFLKIVCKVMLLLRRELLVRCLLLLLMHHRNSNLVNLLEKLRRGMLEVQLRMFQNKKYLLGNLSVRTKVPFEKGYSPMDWMKLTQTHPGLAGLKGQSNKRLISMDEVKQHRTGGSMWTVLKGRVYNLSPYMKFHPGGVDILKKAVGKDCTSLFNKYHAWVNAEFLLEKCLVGTLDVEQ